MPGDHDKKWGDFEKGMSEISTALGIAGIGVQEEIPIDDAKALPDPEDYASHPTKEEVPIDDAKALPDPEDYASHPTSETHSPLDIPWGREVDVDSTKEINMNPKDPGTEEGGMGSGRNPEGPDDASQGQGPGPLISFGETILKEFVDAKISCPCNKH